MLHLPCEAAQRTESVGDGRSVQLGAWRVIDHLQAAWIIRLAERQEAHAEGFRCLEFARGVLAGRNPGNLAFIKLAAIRIWLRVYECTP